MGYTVWNALQLLYIDKIGQVQLVLSNLNNSFLHNIAFAIMCHYR